MGSHYFAILKCEPPTDASEPQIARLEAASPLTSQALAKKCEEDGSRLAEHAQWVSSIDYSENIERPMRISRRHCLLMPDGCHLLFANGAIGIWHSLRCPTFVRDAEWQRALLVASRGYANHFGATKAVITRDGSPIVAAFERGANFDEAIAEGVGEEAEVERISDLYEIIDEHGTWKSRGFWCLI